MFSTATCVHVCACVCVVRVCVVCCCVFLCIGGSLHVCMVCVCNACKYARMVCVNIS